MANVKISELGAAAALDGTEEIPVVQSGETVRTTTQDIADLGGGGLGYLVYIALLTQSGTDNPVAAVLQNTLGGTVVWTREGAAGAYRGTLASTFTENKTGVLIQPTYGAPNVYWVDADKIALETYDFDGTGVDEALFDTMIEIRVFP